MHVYAIYYENELNTIYYKTKTAITFVNECIYDIC